MKMKVIGIDPALANIGLALAVVDLDSFNWHIEDIVLIQTQKGDNLKVVRQNSDDLRRARELHMGIHTTAKRWGVGLAIGEVPVGAQDARAAFSFGVATGLLAGLPVPMIEVQPGEVQKNVLGYRGKDKEAIIAWATGKWPDLPWKKRMFKGNLRLVADNEHMADACAIIDTGLKTQQFLQTAQMMKAAMASAA